MKGEVGANDDQCEVERRKLVSVLYRNRRRGRTCELKERSAQSDSPQSPVL